MSPVRSAYFHVGRRFSDPTPIIVEKEPGPYVLRRTKRFRNKEELLKHFAITSDEYDRIIKIFNKSLKK